MALDTRYCEAKVMYIMIPNGYGIARQSNGNVMALNRKAPLGDG